MPERAHRRTLGAKLRQLAQHGRQEIPPATELEWFLLDRREDVERNIQPALARHQIVVLDRYYFSTIAYQGALQLDPEEIRSRNEALHRLQICSSPAPAGGAGMAAPPTTRHTQPLRAL